jgi:glucosamine-6-phosphate deaminase
LDKKKLNFLNTNLKNVDKECERYAKTLLEFGPDIQIKGEGEDGHWGFHQPQMSFDAEPGFIKVELNKMNISQQMRDHPTLYHSSQEVPSIACTGNVPLFMKTKVLIEDIAPQPSKAFAIVASYGNEYVDPICPSGKIKEHNNSIARLNLESAWALIEYKEKGYLSEETVMQLDKIWETANDPESTIYKSRFMREAFKKLKIIFKDYK